MEVLRLKGTKTEKVIRESDYHDRKSSQVFDNKPVGETKQEEYSKLVDQLRHVRGGSREVLIDTLSATEDPQVIALLVEYLRDSDVRLRNDAIAILGQIGESALPGVTPLIYDRDSDVRKFAINILGDIGSGNSVEHLIPLLKDGDINVCTAALESLSKINDPRKVQPVIKKIQQEKDPWVKIFAIEALSNIDDPGIIPVLLDVLDEGSAAVSLAVLKKLSRIGNMDTVKLLIVRLGKEKGLVDSYIIFAVGNICRRFQLEFDRDSLDHLHNNISIILSNLESKDRDISGMSAYILSLMGPDELIDPVVSFAMSRDELPGIIREIFNKPGEECVRSILKQFNFSKTKNPGYFIRVLGQSSSKLPIPFLLSVLDSQDDDIRLEALNALTEIGAESIKGRLIPLLHDSLGHVRRASAKAMGDMKICEALEDLFELMRDEYEDVRFEAAEALSKIGGSHVNRKLVSLLHDLDEKVRSTAAYGLTHAFLSAEYLDDIIIALNDSNWQVRKYAIAVLSRMPGPLPVEYLIPVLNDEHNEVRMKAINVLCRLAPPDALDYLVPLLGDNDVWVRYETVRGIGNLKDPRCVEVLNQCLDVESSSIVQVAALEGLQRIGGSQGMEAIRRMLYSRDYEVQSTARMILGVLGEDGDAE